MNDGGRLILHSWWVGANPTHPLWADLGLVFDQDDADPPDPVYWWEPDHEVFNEPLEVPELISPTSIAPAVIYGQYVEPLPGFDPLAGYTTTQTISQTALIASPDGRTIFKGFLDIQQDSDLDGDWSPDIEELWVDLINYVLGPPPEVQVSYQVEVDAVCGEYVINPADLYVPCLGENLHTEEWTDVYCPDLGDAPDSTNHYPPLTPSGEPMSAYLGGPDALFATTFFSDSYALEGWWETEPEPGPRHRLAGDTVSGPFDSCLGLAVSAEEEADMGFDDDGATNLDPPNDTPDRDGYDDGLRLPTAPELAHGVSTSLHYTVTIGTRGLQTATRYLNAWFDWNRDGDWADTPDVASPEWAVRDQPLTLSPGVYYTESLSFTPWHPGLSGGEWPTASLWVRLTLAEFPISGTGVITDGRGPIWGYEFGETEDYLLSFCERMSGADFGYIPIPPVAGEVVTFTGSVAAGTPPVTYTWAFGDGEFGSDQIVTHTYAISDVYTVVMTATNECYGTAIATATHEVAVTGEPDITVSPLALSVALNPDDTTTRTLTIGNLGTATLNWGSLAESPPAGWLDEAPASGSVPPSGLADEVMLTFDSTGLSGGTYSTTLQVPSNDPDEPQVNVAITLAVCVDVSGAGFIFAPAEPLMGQTVTFTGAITAGTPPITYTWDFGDGSTLLTTSGSAAQVGNPIAHVFPLTATEQTYTVVMTATNACPSQDTASHNVTVRPRYVYLPTVLRDYP